jgi:Protein of unknown function (DUF1579)
MQISTPLVTHALVGLSVAGAVTLATTTPRPAPHSAPAPSTAQPEPPQNPMDMEAMMKEWTALNAPGEKHEWFKQFVGEWTTTMRMAMPGMEGMPETKGKATYTLMLGDRFLALESVGDFMGQTVTGYGLTGYDNFRNMYNTFYVDSTSTRWYTARGRVSQDGTMLETYGSMDEPTMNEIDKPVRYRVRIIDEDTHVFEAWEVGGLDMKVFEITYKRVK